MVEVCEIMLASIKHVNACWFDFKAVLSKKSRFCSNEEILLEFRFKKAGFLPSVELRTVTYGIAKNIKLRYDTKSNETNLINATGDNG